MSQALSLFYMTFCRLWAFHRWPEVSLCSISVLVIPWVNLRCERFSLYWVNYLVLWPLRKVAWPFSHCFVQQTVRIGVLGSTNVCCTCADFAFGPQQWFCTECEYVRSELRFLWPSSCLSLVCLICRILKILESQNPSCWKGPQDVIWSNSDLQKAHV